MGRGVDFPAERVRMVDRLVRSGYLKDAAVRAAFLAVPREAFVRPEDRAAAYQDVPLPIGSGQTISAPSMIAIMLEEARLEPGERVLEIGTGSGYHAALLASLVGPRNVVTMVVGDGSLGHPDRAPYDCTIATAGAPRIPPAWPVQLAPDGRIVAPIGSSPHGQVLVVATRRSDSTLEVREGTPCAFVPLVGAQAWPA